MPGGHNALGPYVQAGRDITNGSITQHSLTTPYSLLALYLVHTSEVFSLLPLLLVYSAKVLLPPPHSLLLFH